MADQFFEAYKKRVYDKLSETDKKIIPVAWWDSVIKYYYNQGFSEEQTVRVILETVPR